MDIAGEIQKMRDAVTEQKSVNSGAVTLIKGFGAQFVRLSQQAKDALASLDATKADEATQLAARDGIIQQLTDALDEAAAATHTNSGDLASAVTENTPPSTAITSVLDVEDPLIVDDSPQDQPKDGTGRDVNISMAAGTTVSWHVHAEEGPDSNRAPGAKLSVSEFPITGAFEHPEDTDVGAITVVDDADGFGATVTFTTNGLAGGSNAKQRTIGIVISNGNESVTKEVWKASSNTPQKRV